MKVMQLFHELKQQFPTIPDHIVTSCITSYIQSNAQGKTSNIIDLLDAALTENNQEQMGRPQSPLESPSLTQNLEPKDIPTRGDAHPQPQFSFGKVSEKANLDQPRIERNRFEMNESASDFNRNIVKPSASNCNEGISAPTPKGSLAKRPNHLDIKSETFNSFENANEEKRKFNIQLSEKCKDVHKLLNSTLMSDKPPRSPLSAKRFSKNSPTKLERSSLVSPDTQKRLQEDVRSPDAQRRLSQEDKSRKESPLVSAVKKETCSTPSQTTDTLLGSPTPNVNLSLNVNCSVGLVQSPPQPKRTSIAQLTPTQPWLQTPTSPRSYTSVNLTLRPPTSTPQDPIDITSQNSSLTYSTSSFDSQKGLQSRLQITVGPGGGSVSSVRARPRSYHPQEPLQEIVPARAGSLNDLAATSEPPVILKQQARIERLRIELKTEKAKLVIMKQEIADLEKNRLKRERTIDAEVEKQLLMEIKHLRCQCEQLALADKGDEEFYQNIYTGQRGPLTTDVPIVRTRQPTRRRLYYQGPPLLPHPEIEGPKWNCGVCTFLNHPDLDKCEQCEMPRIVHGTKHEAFNRNLSFDTIRMLNNNNFDFNQAARSLSYSVPNNNNNNVSNNISNAGLSLTRPLGFVLDHAGHALSLPGQVVTSHSAPNRLNEYLANNNQNLISNKVLNTQTQR